ncbi:hypothetical protein PAPPERLAPAPP_02460 [Brevundimonas phage vB_BpoS-Papperlapapp]|uniref:Uncharacterized protein n=1 Tax=Brevundimonas phage vB_BpoS-Domovoi TaxID=2948598 RepID=A0A9E7MRX9_9CAUD|nr:hypothetical protein DOMOVOI_01420 [Brevundimonas phage vB_BpoS-Domovoi]USN15987.1 hypothetical protein PAPPERLAPAPP_02460 [Brevundimonas phage vB_BpoS-Papperlapapp]
MTQLRRYHVDQIEITDHREARLPQSDEWAFPILINHSREMDTAYLLGVWRASVRLDDRPGQSAPHDPAAVAAALETWAVSWNGRNFQKRLNAVPFDDDLKTTPGLERLAITLFIQDREFDGPYEASETEEGSEIYRAADPNAVTLVTVNYLEDESLEDHQARVAEVVRGMTWALQNPA